MMSFRTLAGLSMAGLFTVPLAGSAQAQGFNNGSCNSVLTEVTYYENRTNIYYAGGPHLATETTTFTVTGNFQSLTVEGRGDHSGVLCDGVAACNGYAFTAPVDGNFRFTITGRGGAALGPDDNISGYVAAGCQAATTPPNDDEGDPEDDMTDNKGHRDLRTAQGAGAAVAGRAQGNAINDAVNNATGGTTAILNGNGVFVATSGDTASPLFWAALSGSRIKGTADGQTFEFTLGADFEVASHTRLGFLISTGKADLEIAGVDVETNAFSFGPYFKSQLSPALQLSGYAVFARPDYEVGGISYSAERVSYGLRLSGDHSFGNTQLKSWLGVSGVNEDHPGAGPLAAREIRQTTGSLGTRMSFATGAAFRPNLSLAAEFSRFDDGLGNTSTLTSPRIGAGFEYDMPAGQMSFDVSGGRVYDDTTDVQVTFGYNLDF